MRPNGLISGAVRATLATMTRTTATIFCALALGIATASACDEEPAPTCREWLRCYDDCMLESWHSVDYWENSCSAGCTDKFGGAPFGVEGLDKATTDFPVRLSDADPDVFQAFVGLMNDRQDCYYSGNPLE